MKRKWMSIEVKCGAEVADELGTTIEGLFASARILSDLEEAA